MDHLPAKNKFSLPPPVVFIIIFMLNLKIVPKSRVQMIPMALHSHGAGVTKNRHELNTVFTVSQVKFQLFHLNSAHTLASTSITRVERCMEAVLLSVSG